MDQSGAGLTTPAADVDLVAPSSCELGAHCVVAVRLACPDDARCALDAPGRAGAFELLHVDEPPPDGGSGRVREWQLTLVAFEPGMLELPPFTVRVTSAADGGTRVLQTPASRIDVELVAAAEDASLRPDAGPMDPGPDWRVVAGWALAVALVLAAAAFAWRWWRRRPRREGPRQPALSAERAIAAIRALAASPARTPHEVLDRYRALSNALRTYLGLPLDVPAKALTSTELVRAIDGLRHRVRRAGSPAAGHAGAREDAHDRARALLEHVDDVKFGGARPEEATRAEACSRAIALIEALERWRTGAVEVPRDVA